MTPHGRIPAVIVGATLAAVPLMAVAGWGSPTWWAVPLLTLGVAFSETAVVKLQFGRQRWTLSLTDGVIAAAWSLSVGAWSVVAVALGVAVAQMIRRQPRLKVAFNVAMFAAAASLGTLVATRSGGGTSGAVAGMVAFFLVNHTLVVVAVALTGPDKLVPLFLSSVPRSAMHTAGNTSMGLLAAFLTLKAPWGLLGLLLPFALLWSSYDQQTRRSQEARLFEELAAGQERAAGRSRDVSAQVVVTAAARLFESADVEMLLLAADGPVRWAGDESAAPRRLRVDAAVFDQAWVMRALGARGVTTGSDQGRPWCSAVLGDPEDPQAVLIARRATGASGFGRRDVALAELLVGQAHSWLSVADMSARTRAVTSPVKVAGETARALGDLGAAAAPALTVLRESANRIARLTERSDGAGDIVEELHLVERAVASLLGAVALAADPDLFKGGAVDPLAFSRRATDWTTTGVLT